MLFMFQPLCTPIGASSKVVQLAEIIKTKNSESVSVLTWFISAFTNFSEYFYNLIPLKKLSNLLNHFIFSSSVYNMCRINGFNFVAEFFSKYYVE